MTLGVLRSRDDYNLLTIYVQLMPFIMVIATHDFVVERTNLRKIPKLPVKGVYLLRKTEKLRSRILSNT